MVHPLLIFVVKKERTEDKLSAIFFHCFLPSIPKGLMQSIMEFNGHFVDCVVLIQFDGKSNCIDDDLAGIAVL